MRKVIIFNGSSFIYGAERGLLSLVKALKGRFEIIVVLPPQGPLIKKLKELSVNVLTRPIPILMFSISPFYYLKFLILTIFNIIYFTFYSIYKDVDIICSNSILLIFPSIVAKITKKKHIWFVREFFSSNCLNSILALFIKNFSTEIICQSKTIQDKLFSNGKVSVVYEPLDPYDYKIHDPDLVKEEFNLPKDSTVISIYSRIHSLKGQYEFIREIEKLLEKFKDLFLIIAGDISPPTLKNRQYKKKIKKLIEKRNLGNVRLLGFVEDIDKVISVSDLCVFPFKREEPFGIAVTEALSFNKMTFFPQVAGLKEVYDIFKTGEDFDLKKIIEVIFNIRDKERKEMQELYIPAPLSFQNYKEKICSLFQQRDKDM
jgi:glycosyltransferase involved in cell wall biosynthesis